MSLYCKKTVTTPVVSDETKGEGEEEVLEEEEEELEEGSDDKPVVEEVEEVEVEDA
jgi:hypothetical protein